MASTKTKVNNTWLKAHQQFQKFYFVYCFALQERNTLRFQYRLEPADPLSSDINEVFSFTQTAPHWRFSHFQNMLRTPDNQMCTKISVAVSEKLTPGWLLTTHFSKLLKPPFLSILKLAFCTSGCLNALNFTLWFTNSLSALSSNLMGVPNKVASD